jgi:hypothetical protein
MLRSEILKKRLQYARFIHLLIIYILALAIFLFTNLPHKRWILLTVLVISGGIEPGLILKRSRHRVIGTLLALTLMIPLLYLLQLNYRLIPVVFIIALIGMMVSSLNPDRYDISVFFITIVVFFLIAQTSDVHTGTGPFEMVINRAICTMIGIGIVLASDYFLFQTYQYSQKLYLYHQLMILDFLKAISRQIIQIRDEGGNRFLFIERLRNEFIDHYSLINISSENLKLDLKASPRIKKQVDSFQQTIWQLRRLVFALSFSELIQPSPQASANHWQKYEALMIKAKNSLIQIEKRMKVKSQVDMS